MSITYFTPQMLDLDFINSPTTQHSAFKTTVLYAWLLLGPYSVQPPTNSAVRIEASGVILMEVLSQSVKMGHFSSHLDLTKEN